MGVGGWVDGWWNYHLGQLGADRHKGLFMLQAVVSPLDWRGDEFQRGSSNSLIPKRHGDHSTHTMDGHR